MVSDKKVDDDQDKVMDVSHPGKGKIIGTSRPVVNQVADKDGEGKKIIEVQSSTSPSAAHKVIQPISGSDSDEEKSEPESEQAHEDTEKTEAPAAEHEEKQEPQHEDPKPTPKPETPKESEESKPAEVEEGSDTAGVDELAKSVESKKEAAKKAEEQVQKDAVLQELIESKKYFVKIGHSTTTSSSSSEKILIAFIVFLVLVVGAYLVIDAGLVNVNINLPFDIIKG